MDFWTLIAVLVVVFVVLAIINAAVEKKKVAAMSPSERQIYLESKQAAALTLGHGPINPALICPHCQEKGRIRTKPVQRTRGVSGGKATAAILTGGVSMLATGLSRKEQSTQAWCGHYKSTWDF